MTGEVKSRAVKITLELTEDREGDYGGKSVAKHELSVPLPASATDVGAAVASAMTALNEQVLRFRGAVPDKSETAIVTS
jgi:hypothetical protein